MKISISTYHFLALRYSIDNYFKARITNTLPLKSTVVFVILSFENTTCLVRYPKLGRSKFFLAKRLQLSY